MVAAYSSKQHRPKSHSRSPPGQRPRPAWYKEGNFILELLPAPAFQIPTHRDFQSAGREFGTEVFLTDVWVEERDGKIYVAHRDWKFHIDKAYVRSIRRHSAGRISNELREKIDILEASLIYPLPENRWDKDILWRERAALLCPITRPPRR